MKSSNEDKHWQSPSGSSVRPHSPPCRPNCGSFGGGTEGGQDPPAGPTGGQAIEFVLKVIARCCSVTSQLSPVSN